MLPEIGDLHKLALTLAIHWCLETIGSSHLLLFWRDCGLERSYVLGTRMPYGLLLARAGSLDSLFSLTPLLPPLSWNCILLPTQQPVSVPSPINMQLGFHFHFHSQSQY